MIQNFNKNEKSVIPDCPSVSGSSPFLYDADFLKALDLLETLKTIESRTTSSDESLPTDETKATNDLLTHVKGLLFSETSQVTQVSNYLEYLESQIDLTEQEIHRLQKHKQSLELKQDHILDLAAQLMLRTSVKSLQGDFGRKLTLRQTQSVEVFAEPNDLPFQYQRVRIEPNKAELKKALLSGTQIPGCCIVVNVSASWK